MPKTTPDASAKNPTETSKFNPIITSGDLDMIGKGLEAISNLDIEDFNLNRVLMHNLGILKDLVKTAVKTENSLRKKYFQVDDKGNFKKQVNDKKIEEYIFKDETERINWQNEVNDQRDKTITGVKFKPVSLKALSEIKPYEQENDGKKTKLNVLTAAMMAAIQPLIVEDMED